MATNAKCGSTGSTSLGGEVVRWEVNLLEDVPDATSMASGGFKEYIACLKSAEGTFDTLVACGTIGSHASVEFISAVETISMNIIVTDITTTVDVNDKNVYRYTWVSTGEVSIS